jgi:CBS-domain-containing membrane protein
VPVVVQVGDSVAVVVQLLAESRLHHVYVVDSARRPVGVLALTDVLRALVWCLGV